MAQIELPRWLQEDGVRPKILDGKTELEAIWVIGPLVDEKCRAMVGLGVQNKVGCTMTTYTMMKIVYDESPDERKFYQWRLAEHIKNSQCEFCLTCLREIGE